MKDSVFSDAEGPVKISSNYYPQSLDVNIQDLIQSTEHLAFWMVTWLV